MNEKTQPGRQTGRTPKSKMAKSGAGGGAFPVVPLGGCNPICRGGIYDGGRRGGRAQFWNTLAPAQTASLAERRSHQSPVVSISRIEHEGNRTSPGRPVRKPSWGQGKCPIFNLFSQISFQSYRGISYFIKILKMFRLFSKKIILKGKFKHKIINIFVN